MNFNLENPYIENESEEIPYSLYEIHGVIKIKELSQQLQTFQNYKAATVRYRFSPKNITVPLKKDKLYNKIKRKFKVSHSEFIKIFQKIRGNTISFEDELKQLLERAIFMGDKRSLTLFSNLKDVIEELFTALHQFSEHEMYLRPQQLKMIVKLTQNACIVYEITKNWASKFYKELRLNYLRLDKELSLLIPDTPEKKNMKMLEEGLC